LRNAALHAAVLAAPDDDAPRLVYADWLTEHGDPRGEFIAVQVARARRDTPELEAREKELREAHGKTWHAPFDGMRIQWRRGFVESVSVHQEDVGKLEAALDDACVRDLELRSWSEPARVVPLLSRTALRKLGTYYGSLAASDLEKLAPALAHADTIDIQSTKLAADALRALVEAELPCMTALRLACLFLDDEQAKQLARSRSPLVTLSLPVNSIKTGTIAPIVEHFSHLERLDISGNSLREADVLALLHRAWRSLDFGRNYVGTGAARAIASSPRSASLRSLGLADCGIGDEGVDALIASPYLPPGMSLWLDPDILGLTSRGSRWEGELPKKLTDRFDVVIDGEPPY
jgi:uncharacterized protein (TIGR02996 family)